MVTDAFARTCLLKLKYEKLFTMHIAPFITILLQLKMAIADSATNLLLLSQQHDRLQSLTAVPNVCALQ